jgi:hypothetical protein
MAFFDIHALRKEGYKIRIVHHRFTIWGQLFPAWEFQAKTLHQSPSGKGGRTDIELTTPGGVNYTAAACCNLVDNFNHKLGNQICLGRIFKKIENDRKSSECSADPQHALS